MTNTQYYYGEVFNKLENKVTNTTRKHTTWDAAHHAAEKLAKRLGVYGYGYIAIQVRPE